MHNPDWENPMDPDVPLPFKLEGWVDLAPYERTLGMAIESAHDGHAVLTMPFTVKLAQGKGLMHGGAIVSLADAAAAMAIKTLLPPNTHFGTVSLETGFLAPVTRGTVTAHARAWRVGEPERTFKAQVNVTAEGDRTVAQFSSLFRVAKGQGF